MQTQSQEINALLEALSKAQGQIQGAKKDSKNPFFNSKYADLYSNWEAIRGPFCENGLSVIQGVELLPTGQMGLWTILGHKSGQWIKGILPMKPIKEDPQAMGSIITYYRRYGLAAISGVCPVEDDAESAMPEDREEDEKKPKPMPVDYTPPWEKMPEDEPVAKVPTLSAEQCDNIDRLIGNDESYMKAILDHYKKKNPKINFLDDLPASTYKIIMEKATAYVAERNKKNPSVFA